MKFDAGSYDVVAVEAENGQLTGAQLAGDRAGAMLVDLACLPLPFA